MLPLDRQEVYRRRYASENPTWRSSGARLETWVRAAAGPTSRVFDLGAGRGGVHELIWADVALCIGVDPDHASLTGRRVPLPVAQAWGDRLPLADRQFDLALAIWVLEHVADPAATLGEIARVLRPGGRLIFLTPNRRHPLIVANRLSQALPQLQRRLVPALYGRDAADTFRVHYRANSSNTLTTLADGCGLVLERLEVVPDPTYLAFNELAYKLACRFEAWLPAGWGVHLLGQMVKPGS